MIRKYRYGAPFDTEAVTEKIETANGAFPYGKISLEKGFDFTYVMDEDDIVMDLGKPTAASIKEDTAISAIVPMIQTIRKTSVLCMVPTTLSL